MNENLSEHSPTKLEISMVLIAGVIIFIGTYYSPFFDDWDRITCEGSECLLYGGLAGGGVAMIICIIIRKMWLEKI